jgi:hypothetical protein
MKKSLLISALLAVALASTTGCVEKSKQQKEAESYRVFLYNAQGGIIKQWVSDGSVSVDEGRFQFIDKDSGKKIIVAGTVILEPVVAS